MPNINQIIPGLSSKHTPPTLTTASAVAPAGGTGTAAGAFDTAANRDAAIATINSNRTRITEIENALKALGILL